MFTMNRLQFHIFAIVICGVCVAASTIRRTERAAQNQSPSKYDNIDVDRILNTRRLLMNYINCLLDKGTCTPEGRDLKNDLPAALADGCAKCTPSQRKQTEKIISHLVLNYKNEWNQLLDKYDTNGVYRKRFLADGNNK